MNDWLPENVFFLLVRITILLAVGAVALKLTCQRRPAVAIVVARALLVAVWIGPLVVLSGWTLRVAVGRSAPSPGPVATFAESVDPIAEHVAIPDEHAEFAPLADEFAVKDEPVPDPATVPEPTVTEPEPFSEAAEPVAIPISFVNSWTTASWSPWRVIVAVWSIVSGWMLIVFVIKANRTWRMVRRSIAGDESLQAAVDQTARELEAVVPSVRLSNQVAGPCTAGWLRPVVLLPTSWMNRWSPQDLEMILAHELAHAEHRDSAWDALAQLLRVVWWFHPLVAFLARHHRLACEHRCDATAAQIAGDAKAYQLRLAQWALELRGSQSRMWAALAMANRPLLIQRLRWLEKRGHVDTLSGRNRWLACLVCLLVFVAACVVQPTQRLIAAPQPPAKESAEKKNDDASRQGTPKKTELTEGMLALGLLAGPIVWDDKPLQVDWGSMKKLPVTVLDEKNRPLAGAKVTVGTLSDEAGTMASLMMVGGMLTDDRGVAQVLIPDRTARVGLHASASGHATQREDFNTTGKIQFRLKPGRTITVRATDEDGNLLPDAFATVEKTRIWGREFKKQPDGTHLSPDLSPDRRWMRVIDTNRDDGVALFSDIIDLDRKDLADKNGFTNVVLKPGFRLEGRLDDSTQRPVKPGFVELFISEGKQRPMKGDGIEWQEQAKIKPDGTFVFPSLPPRAHAQLFVLGDGYQTREPTREELESYSEKHGAPTPNMISDGIHRRDPMPTLVHLDQPTVKATVPCRKTAGLDVRVVDPAGKPLAGAVATMSPNLYFFGELIIPGTEGSTRLRIDPQACKKNEQDPEAYTPLDISPYRQMVMDSFLQVKTDEKGVARFRNIPSLSESFEIETPGYVMAAYPTSTPEDPGRYGLARNLRPGKVVTKTITMERDMPRTTRELTVIYSDGRPLEDVKVTITDITTSAEDTDWQQWSVQRFGEVSSEQTDKNGRVILWYPQTLENKPVQSLRLYLQGRPEKDVYFYSNLNVPAKADGNLIKFTPEESPRVSGASRVAKPAYVDLATGSDRNPSELLRLLLREPNMITLRQLLAQNKFDAALPLTFKGNRNRISFDDRSPVVRINTDAGWRIVALAGVRPKAATWVEKPPSRFPPEAAFVFDGKGKLLTMLGGGRSASGDYEDIMLTNLGTTGDHFLRTSAFESHPPYETYSRWYRIGTGDQPSLTTYHYANSTSWDGGNGKSNPISEFGYTEYEFNGQDIAQNLAGAALNGAHVPRRIVWDGRRNKWLAESTQGFNARSLYQVVLEESADFVPVPATKETLVASGGRRDYQNWHLWTVTVQDGQDVVARLQRRDADGNTIESVREDVLQPGQHKLQLHIATDQQQDTSTLLVMCDAANLKDRTKYTIPAMKIDERDSVAGQAVYVTSKPPLRLFDKQLIDQKQSLVWVIEER